MKIIKNTRDLEQRQVGFAIVCDAIKKARAFLGGVLGKENEQREKEMVILFWVLRNDIVPIGIGLERERED